MMEYKVVLIVVLFVFRSVDDGIGMEEDADGPNWTPGGGPKV